MPRPRHILSGKIANVWNVEGTLRTFCFERLIGPSADHRTLSEWVRSDGSHAQLIDGTNDLVFVALAYPNESVTAEVKRTRSSMEAIGYPLADVDDAEQAVRARRAREGR